MAEFLAVSCTKELADEIADQCSFDNMKKNRTDPTSLLNDKGSNISLYRKGNFFRMCLKSYGIVSHRLAIAIERFTCVLLQ